MITKEKDYDSTPSFGDGIKFPPKGGYVCKILSAEEKQSRSGKPMIHVAFDIAEGDYEGTYMDIFKKRKSASDNPSEVKYPFEGQSWVMVNDYEDPSKTSRKFKGFCTALEDSGTAVWNDKGQFLVDNLKGALVGIVLQNVESEYNGNTSWRALPWAFRNVDSIRSGDYFVPDDKALPEDSGEPDGFAAIQDDDIPF